MILDKEKPLWCLSLAFFTIIIHYYFIFMAQSSEYFFCVSVGEKVCKDTQENLLTANIYSGGGKTLPVRCD